MVDLCPVVKWSGIQMVVWKPDWKRPVAPKCPVIKWSANSRDFTIWILDTHSDESGIQVFGIQMLAVFIDKLLLFQIRNPRGLDENDVNDLVGNLVEKCHQYVGGPVIFELIDFCQVLQNITVNFTGIQILDA